MQYETTLTHINGLETKNILKKSASTQFKRAENELHIRIDKVKYLAQGSAFPKIKIEYAVVITCYPSDVPVPEAEFMFVLNSPEVDKAEMQENFGKIAVLEEKRARLLEQIEKIDGILDLVRPSFSYEETLEAGNIPDELRISQGLPIPVVQTSEAGRRSEVYIQADKLGR